MNIHVRLSELNKELAEAERLLREALFQSATNPDDPEKPRAVHERREAVQLIKDQIEGFEEAARIDSEKKVEQRKASEREKLKEAYAAAAEKMDERLKVQRQIARALRQLTDGFQRSEALGFELLKLIQPPRMLLHEFSNLKDDAIFPTLAPEWELILNELAAAGLPVPEMQRSRASSYVKQAGGYLDRTIARAERVLAALKRLAEGND